MTGSVTLYVLELENSKYYVGTTGNFIERLSQHLCGVGSAWTHLHRPVDVAEVIRHRIAADEDAKVREYMRTYGIDNVRGGSYCTIELFDHQIQTLQREFQHASGVCFNCGRAGHLIHQCPHRNNAAPQLQQNLCSPVPQPAQNLIIAESEEYEEDDSDDEDCCFRCGREGHWASECYARTHVDGRRLSY